MTTEPKLVYPYQFQSYHIIFGICDKILCNQINVYLLSLFLGVRFCHLVAQKKEKAMRIPQKFFGEKLAKILVF